MATADAETFALIARLLLDDINEVERYRKGKRNEGSPPTDEELSFSAQQKEMQDLLSSMQDLRVAEGLNRALTTDDAILSAFDIAERSADDDRRAAMALGSGLPLPPRTAYQRRVEDRRFSLNIPDAPIHAPPKKPSAPPSFVFVRQDEVENTVSIDPYRSKPNRPFHSHTAKECISCMESFTPSHNLRPACGHDWCSRCIVDLVTACLKDESLYPLRCCGQNFVESEILASLRDRRLHSQFRLKAQEFATPPLQRVYCPEPRCSSFLGPASNVKKSVACESCGEMVCLACKSVGHGDEDCVEQAALTELKELAREKGWQTYAVQSSATFVPSLGSNVSVRSGMKNDSSIPPVSVSRMTWVARLLSSPIYIKNKFEKQWIIFVEITTVSVISGGIVAAEGNVRSVTITYRNFFWFAEDAGYRHASDARATVLHESPSWPRISFVCK
ncbi:hypothetical protein CCMSSC00406_0010111 [Pleurotus cornucopiae]|uniref:Uncharacterized protein n=1 Tax=Pleurotus cornucopiae TaxID=5321 RepID=A0ACB7IIJ4_PLECO|nr:hypothetical protein CCMSSC00406_0010111 [Pleurotus cornucopiae]